MINIRNTIRISNKKYLPIICTEWEERQIACICHIAELEVAETVAKRVSGPVLLLHMKRHLYGRNIQSGFYVTKQEFPVCSI